MQRCCAQALLQFLQGDFPASLIFHSTNMPKIYQRIYLKHVSKYMQDVQDEYKIPSGSRPGPSPGPRNGRAGTARTSVWAGPAAAWYFVFNLCILYILDIWICVSIYLDIIGYTTLLCIFLISETFFMTV